MEELKPVRNVFKNFSYSLLSNLVALLISIFLLLFVPKLIGIEDYGYWQLYLFFGTYLGILHFGWADGIYLRYGGIKYDDLNKKLFHSQFYMFVGLEIIISIVIMIYSFFEGSPEKSFIIKSLSIGLVLMNVRSLILYILQDTAKIKEYSVVTILDRIVYAFCLLVLLVVGFRNFEVLIFADLLGKSVSLIYSIFLIRDIVLQPISTFIFTFEEMVKNISIGIKLLVANFASLLILGVVRYGIQFFWGIKVFGKVSLTLSVSNLLMTFITAVGLVLFPFLRRVQSHKLKSIYINIRHLLMIVMFFALFIYYPIDYILPLWLPKYKDALVYTSILFPMCIYDGKFELLINTFMKTMRMEKKLLFVNIVSVFFSCLITVGNIIIFKNLDLMMFSIVLILFFRSTIAEVILSNELGLSVRKEIILETGMVIGFIVINNFFEMPSSFLLYLLLFSIYVFIERNKIKSSVRYIKKIRN